jgi:hypothetical protein
MASTDPHGAGNGSPSPPNPSSPPAPAEQPDTNDGQDERACVMETLTVFVATLNANSKFGDPESINALLKIESSPAADLVVGMFVV